MDISVIVLNGVITTTGWRGVIACVGDLYEQEGDEGIWENITLNYERHKVSRDLIWSEADIIIPGHGDAFRAINCNFKLSNLQL